MGSRKTLLTGLGACRVVPQRLQPGAEGGGGHVGAAAAAAGADGPCA